MNICEKYDWLPVASIAGKVNETLEAVPRLVITAPPGAGKSTLLPLSMLEAMSEGKKINMEFKRNNQLYKTFIILYIRVLLLRVRFSLIS